MNPTNYETHTFHLNDNMLESRSLFYNVDQELNGPGSRRREWDAETEKTLLQLIIERKFHLEHNTVPNARKNAMWNTLHQDFCNHPNVIHYSKTLLGQIFAQKIRNVRYIKDKFKKMKSDFRKVVVEVRKAGPDSPPPQSRYEHFDEMKEITLGDSNFWPLKVVETDRVRNGAPCSVVYTLRPDGCTYDISYIDETSLTPRFPEAAQSSSFQFVQARVPVVPRPTPEPPSTQMTISSVPRDSPS
ncbi:hypothetical protein CLU79DRAFT_716778 [Phycomyces nitens]|nr:hypothetical protein CLU79DRAFT_716778 [Phycomyces nitens]